MGKLGFKYTTSREAFFKTLVETRAETERRIREEPGWQVMNEFLAQLIFIENCTANGRKPTFEERKSITMGRSAYHAFQGVTDEGWSEYSAKISDLSGYFKFWLSDKGLETADEDDYRFDFPDDEDLSDEPDSPAEKKSQKKR
jgi:hypothetical protein